MKIHLNDLPKASLHFIEPMLAKPVDRLPDKGEWLYELKLDGYRAMAMKKRGALTLFSRRGNKLNARFPIISNAFDFLDDNTILDGEIVALDRSGKPSFSALQKRLRIVHPLYFYAFDLPVFRGRDLRKLSLSDRRVVLEENALKNLRDPVRLSPVFTTQPKRLVAAAKESGLEGIVAKRADSRYESGERSGAWVKYKTNQGQELVIAGYKPLGDVFDYLLAGYYEGNALIFIAKIKNGFTPPLRREIGARFKGLKTHICPFANLPEPQNARRGEAVTADVMKRIQWLRPKLVAHIEFTEWTKGNHLRHSRFVAFRDDKVPKEVRREVAARE